MRVSASVIALLALPSLSLAASLSDFTPRVQNLPSNCQTVYTAPIPGCTSTDFTSGSCSAVCIKGLQSLTAFVQAACSGVAISGNNVVTAFLSGQGVSDLCPAANSAASNTQTSSTLSRSAATTSTSANTAGATTSSTLSSATSTSTDDSSATDSADATSSTSASSTTAATSATGIRVVASTTTSSKASETSSHSGGGSPFDVVSAPRGAANGLSLTGGSSLLLAVMAVLPVLL